MYTSLLIRIVADKSGLKTAQAAKAVKGIFDIIIKATERGDDVRIQGFGTFTTSKRSARTGSNPRTGAPLKIAARKTPKFRPEKLSRGGSLNS